MTLTEIAKLYGVENHRVRYIIESRGIRPASRAGNTDVYDVAALNQISESLRAIQTRTSGGRRSPAGRETRVMTAYETR